jgi:hypothetical protein
MTLPKYIGALFLASVAAHAALINFDSPPAGLTPNYYIQGSPVGASSQLTNQFENLGALFSTFNGAPYAALIDLTGQAPSGTNGVGAVNSAGNVDYTQDLDIFLVVPGTTTPAVTDFISIQGDEIPLPGNVIFSAYDVNGNLLASSTAPDTAGGTYSLSASGIHEFRLHSESGTVAYDNLSFDTPVAPTSAVPEPGTLPLCTVASAGLLLLGARQFPRKSAS